MSVQACETVHSPGMQYIRLTLESLEDLFVLMFTHLLPSQAALVSHASQIARMPVARLPAGLKASTRQRIVLGGRRQAICRAQAATITEARKVLAARGWDRAWIDGVTERMTRKQVQPSVDHMNQVVRAALVQASVSLCSVLAPAHLALKPEQYNYRAAQAAAVSLQQPCLTTSPRKHGGPASVCNAFEISGQLHAASSCLTPASVSRGIKAIEAQAPH